MIDPNNDILKLDKEATLNERIFQEEPVINGAKVRPYNNLVKLKLVRILRWLNIDDNEKSEEILFAFAYLISAPIERVALNTLNKSAYLVDKDEFIGSLAEQELEKFANWFIECTNLEKTTTIEVVSKPGSGNTESIPPN
jgi:hypothetical protein